MPLKDYSENLDRLQRGLGKAFQDEPWMLNVPGQSVACKIDQFYYVAVLPAFVERLGRWGGMLPTQVVETLVKTGNIITRAPEREPGITLGVGWGGKTYPVNVAFVDAQFIDRALVTYGGLGMSMPVSDLKLSDEHREAVESLFDGKTAPDKSAYY